MKYDNIQIVTERAKDNNYTCKVIKDNKSVYLYSKYYPKKDLIKQELKNTNYIVLGLGLGYEIEEISEKTTGNIYIIDCDETFYNTIKNIKELKSIINNERFVFLFGDTYKEFIFKSDCGIYSLNNIISLNENFFYEVLNFFKLKNMCSSNDKRLNTKQDEKKPLKKKKIIFFDRYYNTYILEECVSAFKKMGFEVKRLYAQSFLYSSSENEFNSLLKILIREKPDIVFSVNYFINASLICEYLDIYYISWVVDYPWQSLYSKRKIKNEKEFIFDFEEKAVEDLRKKGIIKNIFYLPCAVNVARVNKQICRNNFITDISFVGNLNSCVKEYLNNNIDNDIKIIIEAQNKFMSKFIIKDLILKNPNIKNYFETLSSEKYYNISSEDYMSFEIAFIQSHISRLNIIQAFDKRFKNFKVYGNDEWSEYIDSYEGHTVEYFNEMPDVFNRSKININLFNTQYETAIPLRLFDILGSAGFILTNYNERLLEYFDNGVDIAVFNNIDEAIELADYYLTHDEVRIKMIENAYEKIKKFHTYEDRIKEMIKIVFG